MKRVIRYDHSIYNDASIFRESRFLYRYFGFEKHPLRFPPTPCVPLRPRVFFFPILRGAEIVSPRERIRETRRSFREKEERFSGREIARAIPKTRLRRPRRERPFILHIVLVVKSECKIRERQRWRPPLILAFSASERADSLPPSRADGTREDSRSSLALDFWERKIENPARGW